MLLILGGGGFNGSYPSRLCGNPDAGATAPSRSGIKLNYENIRDFHKPKWKIGCI